MTTTTSNNSGILAFRGLATIAIGAWIELFMRAMPFIRKLSGSTDEASKDLFVEMIVDEHFYVAVNLVSLVGCALLIPIILKTKTRILSILFWSAMGLGVAYLGGRIGNIACLYEFRAALAEPDQAFLEFMEKVPDWFTFLTNGSNLAGYLSAICLLLLAHRLLPLPERRIPSATLRSSLVLPVVLAAVALIQLILTSTPIVDSFKDSTPESEGGSKAGIGLALILILTFIGSFGRLIWLFTYGKVMWAFSKEMKDRNTELAEEA